MRRLGLTGRYLVVVAVSSLLAALLTTFQLRGDVDDRALHQVVADLGTETETVVLGIVDMPSFGDGIDGREASLLTSELGTSVDASRQLLHLTVHDASSSRVAGSSTRTVHVAGVRAAIAGSTSHRYQEVDGEPALVASYPIVTQGDVAVGAIQVTVSRTAVDARAAAVSREIQWVVMAAVGAVQLLALPLLLRAGRRLRRQHDELETNAADFEHLATHDALTGVPNRAYYQQRVDEALAQARTDGSHPALAILDLNGFKAINDTLGHRTGDNVLQQVAKRLAGAIRPGDTLARFGGDEFVLLLPRVRSVEEAGGALRRVLSCLDEPVAADEMLMVIEATAGVTLAEGDVDRDELMRRADVALYQAKAKRSRVELYRPEHDRAFEEQLTVIADLRDAIDSGDLSVAYQPIVQARTGRLLGCEALLRWDHPVKGPISPASFVPAAERSGLILDLTGFVVRRGLRALKTSGLADRGHYLSINISTRDLVNDDLIDFIRGQLEELDLPGSALHLEITETAALADPERGARILHALADLGVEVAVDDYGTGHSSLSYLQQLPITTLKIDRSFVARMLDNDADLTIVRSTIELAHNLGIQAIAEGVEDVQTMRVLGRLGCDAVQGYLTGRPGPIGDIADFDPAEVTSV